MIYVGTIETAEKLKKSFPYRTTQKVNFNSPFNEEGICCLMEDCDMKIFENAFKEMMFALTLQDTKNTNRSLRCNHIFVHANVWDQLVSIVKHQ